MIEASLRHAAREDGKIDRALIAAFIETFRSRLEENLKGHLRRIPILGR
jgi:hypothetical protein